ncbi:MAG: hypothetical protein R3F56_15625 [Planctomycetota bacterium]
MHSHCSRFGGKLLLGFLLSAVPGQTALLAPNLLLDGGFDVGWMNSCAQGNLPHTWTALQPTPDVYTVSQCGSLDGMPLGSYGHFVPTLQPSSGRRFGAGCWCWGAIETLGTSLLTPLTPGVRYKLEGHFSRDQTHRGNGGYEVQLRTTGGPWTSVGTIGDSAASGAWSAHMLSFIAPVAATELAIAPLAGRSGQWSYNAMDNLKLAPETNLLPGVYSLGGEIPGTRGGPILSTTLGSQGTRDYRITHETSGQAAVIVFGLSTINVPFLGGTIVPSLDVVWPTVAGGSGVRLPLAPGIPLYAQAWVLEPGIPSQLMASPALLVLDP